jgi:cation/acetate symporter
MTSLQERELGMKADSQVFGHANVPAIAFFLLFVCITLLITYWAARQTKSTDDFLAAGHRITAGQNGVALAGDFVAAAGFLGITGLISIAGFDGFFYAVGGMIGWPLMLFLFGEPLRNLGKYTLGDVLELRLGNRNIRLVVSINSLIIVLSYLVMQLIGAGNLIHLLFGISYTSAVMIIGACMLVYVLFGGMVATTWVQIIKAGLMIGGALGMAAMALARFDFNPLHLFAAAAALNGADILGPGKLITSPIEAVSLGLALVLGVASLPHVLMRFFTVPDGRAARMSIFYATAIIVLFMLLTAILGFAAMVLVGRGAIIGMDRGGNMAVPMLAEQLGGTVLLGFIAAVSFATILAAVSGLMITGVGTLAHDIWTMVVRRGVESHGQQMVVARISTVLLAIVAVGCALGLKGQNVAFMVGLATAVAAAANFPAIFLAVYWRRYSYAGAVAGMLTGLCSSLILIYFSPTIQVDVLKHASAWFPLRNPGIVTIPLAFVVSIAVSALTYRVEGCDYAAIERNAILGDSGAEYGH